MRVLNTKTVPNVVPTKTCLPEGSNRTAVGADLALHRKFEAAESYGRCAPRPVILALVVALIQDLDELVASLVFPSLVHNIDLPATKERQDDFASVTMSTLVCYRWDIAHTYFWGGKKQKPQGHRSEWWTDGEEGLCPMRGPTQLHSNPSIPSGYNASYETS